jgi:hypothetical protein
VKNTKPHPKKLDDRSIKMIFVRYEEGSKAYRAYDPCTRCVHVTRDIVFDELARWDWGAEEDKDDRDNSIPFEIEVTTTTEYQQEQIMDQAEPEPVGALDSPGAVQAATPLPLLTPPSVHLASPPSEEPYLDYDHDDAPLQFRRVDNILGPVVVPSLAHHAL